MKVSDLLKEIKKCEEQYGPDFLDWDVFIEVIKPYDYEHKKSNPQWRFISDWEDWEYIETVGFNTKFEKEKIFTVNSNY